MYSKRTIVINRLGIHARPGVLFVKEAKKFSSVITIIKLDEQNKPVNNCSAKSIAKVMAMCIKKGTHIEISAEGEDEQAAVDNLVSLVDSGLNGM
jgi:phosphocarrier protein